MLSSQTKKPKVGDSMAQHRHSSAGRRTAGAGLVQPSAVQLAEWRAALPAGQYTAVAALLGNGGRTYAAAATAAGVSVNTLKTQLRRVRQQQPAVWAQVHAVRAAHLAQRHAAALARADAHSRAWHRRQANRRYRERFGRWPWA